MWDLKIWNKCQCSTFWSEPNRWTTKTKVERQRRRDRVDLMKARGELPPTGADSTPSLRRKSAQTQKVQRPSGLGGYATSRDKRGSFTPSSPARAICSWWEWVGEGAPGTSRTPRAAENNSLAAWNQHISAEIWKYECRWAASQHELTHWRWGLIGGRRATCASDIGNENMCSVDFVQQ